MGAISICLWEGLVRGVRKSDEDQHTKVGVVTGLFSWPCCVSEPSTIHISAFTAPLNCCGPTFLLGRVADLVWVAIGGVSSGVLSSNIDSDADPTDDCPGRLLACVATDGPLGSSSPEKPKSTFLSESWFNEVLLFDTSSRYSPIKASHVFRFSEEGEEDEPEDFCGESGMTLTSVEGIVFVCVEVGFPQVESPQVFFFRGIALIDFLGGDDFLFPAKLGKHELLVPFGWVLKRILEGPGSFFLLIARSDLRKMCPLSKVIVWSEESTIASLTGLKYGSPFFLLVFFLRRLPPVVHFVRVGRLR